MPTKDQDPKGDQRRRNNVDLEALMKNENLYSEKENYILPTNEMHFWEIV